jgi:hypothetical protein
MHFPNSAVSQDNQHIPLPDVVTHLAAGWKFLL